MLYYLGVSRMVACICMRKVRAPQGRMLDNVQWGRPQG